jgi:hypothetical protein
MSSSTLSFMGIVFISALLFVVWHGRVVLILACSWPTPVFSSLWPPPTLVSPSCVWLRRPWLTVQGPCRQTRISLVQCRIVPPFPFYRGTKLSFMCTITTWWWSFRSRSTVLEFCVFLLVPLSFRMTFVSSWWRVMLCSSDSLMHRRSTIIVVGLQYLRGRSLFLLATWHLQLPRLGTELFHRFLHILRQGIRI